MKGKGRMAGKTQFLQVFHFIFLKYDSDLWALHQAIISCINSIK